MMARFIASSVVIVLVGLGLSALVAAASSSGPGGEGGDKRTCVVAERMYPTAKEFLTLNVGHVEATDPVTFEPRAFPVRLRATTYYCDLKIWKGGRERQWSGSPRCVELVSEEPYTWATWVAGGDITLFNIGPGSSYLVWSDATTVSLANTSMSRDRCAALQDLSHEGRSEDRIVCPILDLIPSAREWRHGKLRNALRLEVTFLSLKKVAPRALELVVRNPSGTDTYTLQYKGGEWQVAPGREKAEGPPKQ